MGAPKFGMRRYRSRTAPRAGRRNRSPASTTPAVAACPSRPAPPETQSRWCRLRSAVDSRSRTRSRFGHDGARCTPYCETSDRGRAHVSAGHRVSGEVLVTPEQGHRAARMSLLGRHNGPERSGILTMRRARGQECRLLACERSALLTFRDGGPARTPPPYIPGAQEFVQEMCHPWGDTRRAGGQECRPRGQNY